MRYAQKRSAVVFFGCVAGAEKDDCHGEGRDGGTQGENTCCVLHWI